MKTMYKQALQDSVMYPPAEMRRRIKAVKKMLRKNDCWENSMGCDECPLPCIGEDRLSKQEFVATAKAYLKAYKQLRKQRK